MLLIPFKQAGQRTAQPRTNYKYLGTYIPT